MLTMILRSWLAGIVLFLFPGYAVLVVLTPRKPLHIVEMLCAASGLSIAIVPLLLYVGTYLGLKFTLLGLSVILLFSASICIWDWYRRFTVWRQTKPHKVRLESWLLLLIFIMTLYSRIRMVRGIEYPLWTDSYHHTLITQLIVDHGAIPPSYEPYVPIDRFTYHFGFHTLSAWFHWLSGVPVPRAVVLVGQLLNALVVPTVYFLTQRLFEKRSIGVIAALVTGLLSHMPAFFVNWGRYTQLAGQILLPVLMALTLDVLDDNRPQKRGLILLGVSAAGLFLVHIRIFLFYAIFAAVVFFFKWIEIWRNHKSGWLLLLFVKSVCIGAIFLLVLLPWLWQFMQGYGTNVMQEVQQGYQSQRDYFYFRWQTQQLVELGMRLDLLILAALGTLWGLLKRERGIYLIFIWVCLLFLAANCYLLDITPLISNLIVIIALYLPCAVIIDYFVTELAKMIRDLVRTRRIIWHILRYATAVIFVILCLWGVNYEVKLLAPENGFVQKADIQAMQWIRVNIPDQALFYVSVQFWTPITAHGLDAGYWLPLLAERQTIMPPEVYGSDGTAEYMASINKRAQDILEAETPEALWQVLTRYGVTHVYIGHRKTYLDADFFLGAPKYFVPIYAQSEVWIFELKPSVPAD